MARKRGFDFLAKLSIAELLAVIENIAAKYYDGHYTIMAFTTGYKVAFGTPDLDSGKGRHEVLNCPQQETLPGALVRAIIAESEWSEWTDTRRSTCAT